VGKIRVLLVDDHALVRRGFRRLLEDDPEIEVAGEAADGMQAEEMAAQVAPDVVVLDYALPGQNGALTARRLLARRPALKILMLSMHAEATYVEQSRQAGASGYLLKNALDLELVDAVKRVAAGEWVQDPRLAQASSASQLRRPLTTREMEVVQLIVAGQSNKEIAATLQVSANTVAVHRANIMAAMGVNNTADLVVFAIRHGLAGLP
jgi:DNA-binding NarL/FixJ family response regulator